MNRTWRRERGHGEEEEVKGGNGEGDEAGEVRGEVGCHVSPRPPLTGRGVLDDLDREMELGEVKARSRWDAVDPGL